MKMHFDLQLEDLWRWDGTVSRGAYAIWGVLLFAVKHNLDRLVAAWGFGRGWSPLNYIEPSHSVSLLRLSREDVGFYATLLLLALPFIWTGVALTLRRLRSAQLPGWLVLLFFVPLVNLIFFVVLSVLPARLEGPASARDSLPRSALARLIPNHPMGAAAMGILLTSLLAVGATVLSVNLLQSYGWSLFVGLPFAMGLCSVLLYCYHEPRNLRSCLAVSVLAISLLGGALLAFAVEGAFCLAMALPLGIVLAALGGTIGYAIQRRSWRGDDPARVLLALMLAVPALMGMERATEPEPALIPVRTVIEIDAPPEVVWRHVVAFSEIGPPEEWIFRIGIAYPIRAAISGQGPGAVRRCVFSTGDFVEPIEVWDAPKLLKFGVTEQPPAMREWSPWGAIPAPHIDDFLVSEGGQFLLEPLANGRTRLEGTTWYRHRIWPGGYWRPWSDWILHKIHLRVLRHVQSLSERDTA